ncbi:hypothetical protein EDD11_003240 [Mortierella claussenii]|nr:hypothetical protein EDD11_003240 [Mortierella claussenii]
MDSFDRQANTRSDASETGSLFISLACITVMSTLFGRKTAGTTLRSLNYARGLVVGLYLFSWLFSVIAAMLVQTNNFNMVSCELSVFICIILYTMSKVLIYLFLIERVHIVTAVGITRWNCPMFKFNMAVLAPYIGIFALAIYYRVGTVGDDTGICLIGLEPPASIPLIVYDVLISGWLTALFLRALLSSTSLLQGPSKSKLRDVARRTLLGSLLATLLSCANIATLVYYEGYERGVICMASCTMDVTLNAITIHWVTSRGGGSSANSPARGASNVDHRISRLGGQQFAMKVMNNNHKDVGPVESHISVSIESYVEEYHKLHIANKSPHSPEYHDHTTD